MTGSRQLGDHLQDLDRETALKILETQLEDINEVLASQKGKERAGEISAIEHAFLLQQEAFRADVTSLKDQTLCQSISTAVQNDGVAISLARAEELQSALDNSLARDIDNAGANVHHVEPTRYPGDLDLLTDDIVDRLASFNMFEINTEDLLNAAKGRGDALEAHDIVCCTACTDSVPAKDAFIAPCEHPYCSECVCHLFRDALTDESLFPPRCCRQELSLSMVRHIIGPRMTQKTEIKGIEIGTTNRVYCSNLACSSFIPPYLISGSSVTCPKCSDRTCVACKRSGHGGDCDGAMDREVLQLAGEAGWQRCYQCQSLVELGTGCNHITCRCRAEFCYVCGARWKSCTCAQWDEDRLVERAAAVVDRRDVPHRAGNLDAAAGVAAPAQRQHQIARMAAHLRERHECDHNGRWFRRQGSHRCEECAHVLPDFILECHQCHLMACVRCRRNRL